MLYRVVFVHPDTLRPMHSKAFLTESEAFAAATDAQKQYPSVPVRIQESPPASPGEVPIWRPYTGEPVRRHPRPRP